MTRLEDGYDAGALVEKLLEERDHARALACRLEQELAHVQASQERGATNEEPDA